MKLTLMFLESYDFKPKDSDKVIKMFVFVDPQSLTILTGSNLDKTLKKYEMYDCSVELKANKLKVKSIL